MFTKNIIVSSQNEHIALFAAQRGEYVVHKYLHDSFFQQYEYVKEIGNRGFPTPHILANVTIFFDLQGQFCVLFS